MRMRAQHRLQQHRRARPWPQRQRRWVQLWPRKYILPAFFLLNVCSLRHSLGTCSSVAGAYKCCRRRSLCIYSALVGADRCCCRRRLYRRSSAVDVRRSCCRRSLCMHYALAGARRGHCRRSLCTGSSAAGVRTAQGGASLLQKDVAPNLWPRPMHWLGSHHALRAGRAFLVAPQMCAPPASFSCRPQQPPGHPCDPTSYSAAYPPRRAFCVVGAVFPLSCSALVCVFCFTRPIVTL